MSPGADKLRQWRERPIVMVRDLFGVEPDAWQAEALEAFPRRPRISLQACTGPGKTCLLAWLGWNFVLTRPHAMIGATSINAANLKTNLWTELARWRGKSPLLQSLFEQTATEIYAKESRATWRIEARSWAKDANAEQIGNALRGLHAPYVMWLLDETGDYPGSILPVCEAIFSGEPKEAHIVQAGNPIKRDGPLWHASCTPGLWHVIKINADPDDPKRTPRVSIEHAREQINQWGRDNPWVMVNILGQFPATAFNALISAEECEEAQRRAYRDYEIGVAAKVMGVDVARFGDDSSVIAFRKGIQAYTFVVKRGLDSTQGAGLVARHAHEFQADAIFVDDTGGFGSGWIDQLRNLGRSPIGVHFAGEAHNKARYHNKRAEMYFDLVEWIKRGGALPPGREIVAALSQTNYTFGPHGDRLILEPKEIVKQKLGYSPDAADALCLTFAEPVLAQQTVTGPFMRPRHTYEYDPYR